jgi:hypothetical protein
MHRCVARAAQRDEVFFCVLSAFAPRHDVVNHEIESRPTTRAFLSVSFDDARAQIDPHLVTVRLWLAILAASRQIRATARAEDPLARDGLREERRLFSAVLALYGDP